MAIASIFRKVTGVGLLGIGGMQSFSVGSALYGASAVGAAIPLAPAAFVVGLAALPVVGGIMLLSKD